MICQERSGFLFAHACDRPAVWNCTACGKLICAEHTRMAEAGYTCISCLHAVQAQQAQEQRDQQDQAQGQTVGTSTNDPYFYDDDTSGYYDVDDYGAFDEPASASSAADGESDLGGS